jgi:arsenate reductase
MKTHPREILFYYNSASSSDKKTLAYAKSMSKHVKAYTYEKAFSTDTNWLVMLQGLEIDPKKLLNKAHPDYQKNFKGMEMTTEDWIMTIKKNPHLIKSPIAIRGNKAIVCGTPTDIYKL